MAGKEDFDVAVTELMQAVGLIFRRIRAVTASQDELTMTESSVLARLERQGPATAAELARAESMKPQSMGSTIAALEERGLVQRKAHATDGRQMNIELTATGKALRTSVFNAKRAWLGQAISALNSKDQQTLFAAAKIIKRLGES